MKTIKTTQPKSMVDLTVTLTGEKWEKAQKKAFNKLAEGVEIKGFRKGSVPESMLKKSINTQQVLVEAVDHVLNEMFTTAADEHAIWPVSRPTVDVKTLTEAEIEVVFSVAVKPELELANYKGLSATKAEVVVTDEEVASELAGFTASLATEVTKEGAVELGDTAIIDFEGFKDGIAFDGGKAENHPLEIGSGQFIPGFEEQIIGMEAGQTKDIEVTFPEEYPAEDLAGAPVVFKVTLHEIKTKQTPELTDEIAAGANIPNVSTVAELNDYLMNSILDRKTQEADFNYSNDLMKQVVEASTVDLPEAMVNAEVETMYNSFVQRMQQQGIDEAMFFELSGQTKEQITENFVADATEKIKYTLTLEAIAKAEGIEATEEELEAEFAKIAAMYNMEVAQVKEIIKDTEAFAYEIKLRKAVELVKSLAV